MKTQSGTSKYWALACGLFLLASWPAAAAQGDWLIRVRGISVDPNSSSGPVSTNGTAIPGSGVTVDDDIQPELDITYMVADNWGLELILASSEHDVFGNGSLASFGKILDARTLPPALLLQYHFAPDGKVRPYLGLGVNYTLFFSESATSSFETAAGGSSNVDLSSSFGLAAQLGLDVGLSGDWFLNVDVKYVDMSTDATITTPGPLGTLRVDVNIDPTIWGIGIGKRF